MSCAFRIADSPRWSPWLRQGPLASSFYSSVQGAHEISVGIRVHSPKGKKGLLARSPTRPRLLSLPYVHELDIWRKASARISGLMSKMLMSTVWQLDWTFIMECQPSETRAQSWLQHPILYVERNLSYWRATSRLKQSWQQISRCLGTGGEYKVKLGQGLSRVES